MGNQQGGSSGGQGQPRPVFVLRNPKAQIQAQAKQLLEKYSVDTLRKQAEQEKLAPLDPSDAGQIECPICFMVCQIPILIS